MISGAALLAATAELGEYFAIDTLGVGQGEEIAALVTDAVAVRAFVDGTRSALAASLHCPVDLVPLRVAASSFHLNVVARLLSPAVGAAVALGTVPVLTPASVRWWTTAHHTPRFGVTDLEWAPAPTPLRAAESIAGSLLGLVIEPLNHVLRAALSLSTHVTRGNVISAANGAVSAMAMSRPDLELRGRELVRALLSIETLTRTGRFTGERFVRHSCCLFYRAPGNGLCVDCVLAAPPRSAQS